MNALLFLFFFEFVVVASAFLVSTPTRHQLQLDLSLKMSTESKSTEGVVDSPSQKMLEEVLGVAMEAGRKAGDIILGNAGGAAVTKRKANSRDLLTLIDPLCEKIIKETVLQTFPNHDFLGEEDVPPGKEASAAAIDAKLKDSKSNWLWIVDPIDGTTNFVSELPC
jgi:myo-inositol-1(or 4)-monophosphatase